MQGSRVRSICGGICHADRSRRDGRVARMGPRRRAGGTRRPTRFAPVRRARSGGRVPEAIGSPGPAGPSQGPIGTGPRDPAPGVETPRRDRVQHAPRADHGPARLSRPPAVRGGRRDRPASRGLPGPGRRAIDAAESPRTGLPGPIGGSRWRPPTRCRSGRRSIGSVGPAGFVASIPRSPMASTSRSIG